MELKEVVEIEPQVGCARFSAGREIVFVGTAHVSAASVEQVRRTIEAETSEAETGDSQAIKANANVETATTLSETSKDRVSTSGGEAHHDSELDGKTTSKAISPQPLDQIFLELDDKRLQSLEDKRFKEIDIRKILRTKQGYFFVAYLLLAYFQRKIAEETGSEPGGEFKEAVRLARAKNIELSLIDRPADITLKRAWRLLGVFAQLKFLMGGWSLPFAKPTSPVENGESTVDFIESLKERDKINEIMREFEKPFPVLKRVIIDERDQYMAEKIWQILLTKKGPFKGLVVIGAGHVPGMLAYWQARGGGNEAVSAAETRADTIDAIEKFSAGASSGSQPAHSETLPQPTQSSPSAERETNEDHGEALFARLEETPPPSRFWRTLKLVLPIMVIGVLAWGFVYADWNALKQAFLAWVIANGVFAAIGALIARGHPLTVLTALVASPITSLNPTIGAGFLAAWVEMTFNPPRVEDLESVQLRLSSLAGWWKNRLTRILLVFVFVSMGSALGAWIALPFLLRVFV